MQNLKKEYVKEILTNCRGKKIAVIGDVMLDRYFWGSVNRVSPEAPVPVIDIEKETFHLGGAANVASNLNSLGITSILCGVIGLDNSGRVFRDISLSNGIDCSGLYEDINRHTTVKTRIIGNNQQIARLDREIRDSISTDSERFILNCIHNNIDLSGIIFEDYNKGTITEFLILEILSFARLNKIPVYVDPKHDNFFLFQNATVFKPNRKEAGIALGITLNNKSEIELAGKLLLEKLNSKFILLTLGSDGMILFEDNGDISSVPTHARKVADVSGAGDTTIATLAAAYSGGATMKEAASIANLAAGAVCEEPGIVSITPEKIIAFFNKINGKT